MKKALIVSTVSRQFTLFERGNIEVLKELGYEIHGAANYEDATPALEELDIKKHHIDIQRSPFKLNNLKAYKQLVKLMKEEKFDLVHCHAPMGGVVGRLATKSVGIKNVLYTAHGFHFFKGAPKLNWMIYYPIEKLLSRYTNTLITINEEDYSLATSNKFKAKNIELVNGIGLNLEKFSPISEKEKYRLREEYGYDKDDKILIYVGELSDRKNQKIIIEAVNLLKKDFKNIKLLLVGRGQLKDEYDKLIEELGVQEQVELLGFRTDINQLLRISDIYVCSSRQEGLPVNIMEAMSIGLPVVCSKIRGNVDLIEDTKGGYLVDINTFVDYAEKISEIIKNPTCQVSMKEINIENVKKYNITNVEKQMKKIYTKILRDEDKV
ncbi:glycosyltransferase family 4 protein [Turicibacter sanguinis]|uniref:glycosyltransferase family 4 protein n=1 Tax=Turicibacter sanguinis TaxID=154288 RepID=UPI0006C306DB|nr:glycosyltransferase family 4 protein [Turicibacter sanguinis]MDB8576357.1 glycosyltransferase family 4 protein [Turicibacter sanguinis]MDB8579313.1 glycosyltransferase family 4 protein [Turicibacter sanguinis]MDB8585048.1 glycosyltransferase family 4 protein [Turicibacter sanguinis]MDB8588085.1 glycosyltransferase family 4 protein [Turicibacter sanguinis]MDB8598815.1 glycosyltransferase family 4 protein [Turicibacter sanguinis]